ncbi:MAG: DUF192 domain-containing protein [Gemmatimonadales bacterium]
MLALLVTFTVALGFIACDSSGAKPPATLPTREITVTSEDGNARERLTVELATTPLERQQGLMFRQVMDEDRGMLFLFPREQPATGGFWMHNTYIPLTIAYLDADGKVLVLKDGKPLDDTLLRPELAYHAVLEVNQGWFQRHGMGAGSFVDLPDDTPTPR